MIARDPSNQDATQRDGRHANSPSEQATDADTNPDLPDVNPEGMTVEEAREAGWDLHPELPDDTEILVDLRTHTYYDGRPLPAEVVPALWYSGPGNNITEDSVNRVLDGVFGCIQGEEWTYELTDRDMKEGYFKMDVFCEYTGHDDVGDTGKPVTRVTVDDIDQQTTTDDGLHVFDNILCDISGATPGCPKGDFGLRVLDEEFTIRIDGFDLPDGQTWRFEGQEIQIRQDSRNWLSITSGWYLDVLERAAERG